MIFQEKTDAGSNYTSDYRWVVCVPLLIDLSGPAIGIVSFASPDDETDGDRWLQALARDAASEGGEQAERARHHSDALLEATNVKFWEHLKTSPRAPRSLQLFADDVLRRFDRPAT